MIEEKAKLSLAKLSDEDQQNGRHILIVESSDSRRAVALNRNVFSIGRHPQNSLVINNKLASRHHATIAWLQYSENPERQDYCYWIIDGKGKRKRSRNGMTINGEKKSLHRLQSGDVIVIGIDTKITYNYIHSTAENQSFLKYCGRDKAEYRSKQKLSYKETTSMDREEIEAVRKQYNSII